jgi:hypothetical protein
MECVCGCGTKLSKDQADRNYIAANVAIELLAWDKNRALPGAGPEGREGLIARGVEQYERLLYSLHGEGAGDPDEDANSWLEESRSLRSNRSDMTKRRFLGGNQPNVSKEDMERLDRRHPDRSFTGGLDAVPAAASRPEPSASAAASAGSDVADAVANGSTATRDDDFVAQLERLRALRDDDALTEAEFAAAKARLLGRD